MPYFVDDSAAGCNGFATVKEDGEVIGCHTTKEAAIAQMVAVSIAEDLEPGGDYNERVSPNLPAAYRPASSADVPANHNCGNCGFYKNFYCKRWDALVAPAYYCAAWEEVEGLPNDNPGQTIQTGNISGEDAYYSAPFINMFRQLSAPAPAKDQIEGSKKNPVGSAAGPPGSGTIELTEAIETALSTKVTEHNESLDAGDPSWKRATPGMLRAVYRRGSGAYSTSHRPGVSRGAWSMARVSAFLVLLKSGRPANAAYITDNDLLPKGHPRSSRK